MSRKGKCYDNAQAESFFSRFKAELLEDGIFESVEDAKSEVFSYIEAIRIESDCIRESVIKVRWSLKII